MYKGILKGISSSAQQDVCPWHAGEAFPLHGMLRRTLLLRLLKHRIGIFAWDGRGPIPLSSSQVSVALSVTQYVLQIHV